MKIVCIGGGTGLPIVLRGLRQTCLSSKTSDVSITAIVCVSDNGGSSGELRQSFGIPAVGDLRNCLVALADGDSPLSGLFQHRLSQGHGLRGHALGNLVVTALCERTGSLLEAVDQAAELLQARGRVLPSTEAPATLCAEFTDGAIVRGETQVASQMGRISRMWLEAENLAPAPGLLAAIEPADVIVFGPGSLFTSILPNLLIPGVTDAIRDSSALKIQVCNLMTQPGETDGFRASDHLRVLLRHLGEAAVDACVMNSGSLPEELVAQASYAGSHPVFNDIEAIRELGARPVLGDVLGRDGFHLRHDPMKLADVITEIAAEETPEAEWAVAAAGEMALTA
ncbi:MAG TPA: gluconeogenesis factor YvcK family protein [Bryobacteraceae bacterium]|nr:gluconeogenesis factor YvcK family protein [Bryobacteraceae bacterium]